MVGITCTKATLLNLTTLGHKKMKNLQTKTQKHKKTDSVLKDFLYSLVLIIALAGVGFLLPNPSNSDNFGDVFEVLLDD